MNDALKTLDGILQGAAILPQPFPRSSRYFGLSTRTMTVSGGRVVVYLGRRFVPPPETLAPLAQHTVVQGDRLDTIASQQVGDAEQYWRLCDANNALRPDELLEPLGRRLVIPLPAGIPRGTRSL
jgi:hypothetical protein